MLLVGLGNPGSEYEKHRHNVGFMAIHAIANGYGFSTQRTKFNGLLCDGLVGGTKVYAIKPMTYMNESGICVGKVAQFYKIPPEDIYVFHDELDIPVGKLKVKNGGGAGGHNGIKSIDSHIGKGYNRIRIGIDHPGHKDRVNSYVLSNFKKDEREQINLLIGNIVDNLEVLLHQENVNFTTKLGLVTKQT